MAVVGHGAGKTTFAHMLCGFICKGRSTMELGDRNYRPKERTRMNL